MNQHSRLILFVFAIFLHVLISGYSAKAQDTPDRIDVFSLEVNHPNLHPDCERIERFIDLGFLPESLVKGGGQFRPAFVHEQAITALDAGDRWVFASGYRGPAILEFTSDIDLLLQIYRGVERIDRARIRAGEDRYEFSAPEQGVYTAVVTRMDVSDVTVEGNYTVQFTGDVARVLDPREPLESVVGPNNRSDAYIFFFRLPNGVQNANVSLSINSDQGVRFRMFDQGELVDSESQDLTAGNRSVTIAIDDTGYYFPIVAPFNNDENSSYTISLRLVEYEGTRQGGSGGLWQPRWESADQIQPLRVNDNGGVSLQFGQTEIEIPVDFANAIVPSSSSRFEYIPREGERQTNDFTFINQDLERLVILDGNVNVASTEGTIYYIEDLPHEASFSDTTQFRSITLFDDRSVKSTNRTVIQSVWILPNCIGFGMTDNRSLIMESNEVNLNLLAGQGSSEDPLTQQIIEGVNATDDYNFRFNWAEVTDVIASAGVITIKFTDDRIIQFDRPNITVQRDENNTLTIIENIENEQGQLEPNELIVTDWENLLRLIVNDEVTIMDVLDERGRIIRQQNRLQRFSSREAIIRLQFETRNELLLLPESFDYLQIETPREPFPYNILAIPGEPGYLPAFQNNTGQQCSSVNTAFSFECASNGGINPVNGNLTFSVMDLFADGYRVDLQLSRTYNSLNYNINGPFGRGWDTDYWLDYDVIFNEDATNLRVRPVSRRSSYDIGLNLIEAARGQIIFKTATGTRFVFNNIDGVWISEQAPAWKVEPRADVLTSPWRIVRPDGLIYQFDLAGRLRLIEHPHGGSITITRTSDTPVIYTLTDDVGRRIELEYDANYHIVRSTLLDADGNELGTNRYTYENDLLIAVEYWDGMRATYTYTADGQLESERDPRAPFSGDRYINYDPQLRVRYLSPVDDTENRLELYRYNDDETLLIRQTQQTNNFQQITTWDYQLNPESETPYRLLKKVEPDGTELVYEYRDTNPTLITNIARNGSNYTLNYLNNTLLESLVHPQAWINFSSSYTQVPAGENLVFRLLRYRTNDLDSELERGYIYDESGQVLEINDSDERTNETRITVNERHPQFGLPTRLTIDYPTLVELTGNPDVDPIPEVEEVIIRYDEYGYPSAIQRNNGVAIFTWDAIGRLTHYQFDGHDETLIKYDIVYVNSSVGQMVTVTDSLGTVTTYMFNPNQQLVNRQVVDRQGNRLESVIYAYDLFGRLTVERHAVSDSAAEDLVTRYQYVGDGLDAPAQWRRITFHPDNTTTMIDYDGSDRIVRTIDEHGLITEYTYESQEDGLLINRTEPHGTQTTFFKNLAGQLCSVDYGDVEWLILYTGNTCNSTKREVQRVVIEQRLDLAFSQYDEDVINREYIPVISIPSLQDQSTFTRLTGARDNPVIRREYDSRRRLTRIWNVSSGDQIIYTYTRENGKTIVTAQYSNLVIIEGTSQRTETIYHTVRYTYDELNRLIAVNADNTDIQITYQYLIERGLLEIHAIDGISGESWTAYFDSLGQLREWISPTDQTTSFIYDQSGRLLSKFVDGLLEAQYTYDNGNRVTSMTDVRGRTQTYLYNTTGQLVQYTDVDGVTERYTYDAVGNVNAVIDALGNATLYQYDDRRKITDIIYPDGHHVQYEWREVQGTLIYRDGDQTTTYHFDLLDRLHQINTSSNAYHRFNYNATGLLSGANLWNETDLHHYGYGAGTNLQYLSYGTEDILERPAWLFNYDGFGNLIERIDSEGLSLNFEYDSFNRLTALSDLPHYSAQFDYTKSGVLTHTLADQVTRYEFDALNRLTETSVNDSQVAQYTYTDDDTTITMTINGQTITSQIATNRVDDTNPYILQQDHVNGNDIGQQYVIETNDRGDVLAIHQDVNLADVACESADCEQWYRRTELIEYDVAGRPVNYQDANGHRWSYQYDERGRLIRVVDQQDRAYQLGYNSLNQVTSVINPQNDQLSFVYNDVALVTEIRHNDFVLETYLYDDRQLIERRFPAYVEGVGREIYTYDTTGNLASWSQDNLPPIVISRDGSVFAHVTQIAGEGINLGYEYNELNQLIESQNNRYRESYQYDDTGKLTGVAVSSSGQATNWTVSQVNGQIILSRDETPFIRWTHNANELPSIVETNTSTYTLEYQTNNGQLVTQMTDSATGTVSTLTYDKQGNIVSELIQNGDTTKTYSVVRDDDGRILEGQSPEMTLSASTNRVGLPRYFASNDLLAMNIVAQQMIYDDNGRISRMVLETEDGKIQSVVFRYSDTNPTQLIERITQPPPNMVQQSMGIGVILLLLTGMILRRKNRLQLIVLSVMSFGLLVILIVAQEAPDEELSAPDPQPILQYNYDPVGRVSAVIDLSLPADANMTQFEYNPLGQVTTIRSPQQVDRFIYDGFGHLIEWQSSSGTVQYEYVGSQLVNIRINETDVTHDLLQKSLVTEQQIDPFGGILSEDALFGIPTYRAMIYLPDHQLYINQMGELYDPLTGRWMQPSLSRSIANGAIYTDAVWEAPVIQKRQPVYFDGLRHLLQARHILPMLTAETVSDHMIPVIWGQWHERTLQSLADYNEITYQGLLGLDDLPHTLAYFINPPGTVVDADNHFRLLDNYNPDYQDYFASIQDLVFTPDFTIQGYDLRWTGQELGQHWIETEPPVWLDFDKWKNLAWWEPSMDVPMPRNGFPLPDDLAGWFNYPLSDLDHVGALFDWLDEDMSRPAQELVSEIELMILPQPDMPSIVDSKTLLSQWFTDELLDSNLRVNPRQSLANVPAFSEYRRMD